MADQGFSAFMARELHFHSSSDERAEAIALSVGITKNMLERGGMLDRYFTVLEHRLELR